MIIGVDANEANVQERVGVGWCVFHLLFEFAKLASTDLQFCLFLKQPPQSDLPKTTPYFKYAIVSKKTLWSQIDLPLALYLRHRNLDVFLSPAHYAPRFAPCPTVVIIHDLSYFYYPQDFLSKDLYQLVNWTRYSVQKASKVIAVSEITKQDLIKNYHLSERKIIVIKNGFSNPVVKPIRPAFAVEQPYFLYLGTLQPRKNIQNLILGFEKFLLEHPHYHLYLAGRKGWLYQDILALIEKRKLTSKIVLTDYITEAEKWFLLKHAQALVMPGFYEGFGLPILDAFYSGTPVLVSSTGALPEIAQNAALYFNPISPIELAQAMQKLVKNVKIKQSLIKNGKSIIKNYSWYEKAKRTIEICKSLRKN